MDRRRFLRACSPVLALPLLPRLPHAAGSHPHAALFVYTRPLFADRHRFIVDKALQLRAKVHTSAWQKDREGNRILQVGPVRKRVHFWHGEECGKPIRRAWPFAAVLEYAGEGGPRAYIDWFRRAGDSKSPDGWLLDPGVGYAQHINKEMVTHRDRQWHYMAVPDTPTDTHVGDSQFAIRARIRWQDGRRAQLGLWLGFEAPRGKGTEDWHCRRTPLVDWYVATGNKKLGATSVRDVEDPDRQLAVWGTDEVFRFPPMPEGLRAGQ